MRLATFEFYVGFVAAIVKLADPRVALRLARQQVNLFEIFPFFVLLHNELAVACGGGELHLIQQPIAPPHLSRFFQL